MREGWGEAYFAANAGAVPNVAGQLFAGAVDFACRVARAHGKPLREAARDIAAAALARDANPDAVVFALSRVDPYVAQVPPKQRPKTLGEQLEAVRAQARALHAEDRWDEAKPLEKRIDELMWQVKQKGAEHVAR